jgi:hypothetical protein
MSSLPSLYNNALKGSQRTSLKEGAILNDLILNCQSPLYKTNIIGTIGPSSPDSSTIGKRLGSFQFLAQDLIMALWLL